MCSKSIRKLAISTVVAVVLIAAVSSRADAGWHYYGSSNAYGYYWYPGKVALHVAGDVVHHVFSPHYAYYYGHSPYGTYRSYCSFGYPICCVETIPCCDEVSVQSATETGEPTPADDAAAMDSVLKDATTTEAGDAAADSDLDLAPDADTDADADADADADVDTNVWSNDRLDVDVNLDTDRDNDLDIDTTPPDIPFVPDSHDVLPGSDADPSATPGFLDRDPTPTPAPAFPRPGDGTSLGPDDMQLLVSVPENARIYINDKPTATPGRERQYVSRNLIPGLRYTYRVRAEVTRGGRTLSQTKVVGAKAGDLARLAFDFPEEQVVGAAAPKPVQTSLTLHVPADGR